MLNSEFDPEYVFTHHSATPEKLRQYGVVHDAAKQFARVLLENVPASGDRDSALRLLRESAMMACAAISLDGRLK
jgi:tryptophanyl-tRNA synthetase